MYAIINAKTYDFNDYRENAYVIFDSKIADTGSMKDYETAAAKFRPTSTLDARGALLMPGFAICHTHIYSAFAKGLSLPFSPKNFTEVLEQLWWKLDAALDNEAVYYSGLSCAAAYIANGVTTIIDHHASGRDIEGSLDMLKKGVVDDFGLKGMFCFETSDRFDTEACINENLRFAKSGIPGSHKGLFGLHASMTLSDKTLAAVKESIGDMPIHIHAAESIMDQEDSRGTYNKSVIERLDGFGLLTKDSIIVHGTYLTETELDILAARGCVIAVNPSSNMNNGVGLPDVRKMKKRGVPVMLGNDGMSGGIAAEWQFLILGMHHRYEDPVSAGLEDLEEIINNGYAYINRQLEVKTGRIKRGYEADLQLIDYLAPTPLNAGNCMGHLFFGNAYSHRPSHVWSKGAEVLNNYRHVKDVSEVMEKSRRAAENVWKSLSAHPGD